MGAMGKRGVWFRAKDGVHPNRGKNAHQPAIRYCCTIEKTVVTIQ